MRVFPRKFSPARPPDFPSFSEGLSLRVFPRKFSPARPPDFPSFSEGLSLRALNVIFARRMGSFPFLFGGTFIEGPDSPRTHSLYSTDFPSFSEGLSLRDLHAELPAVGVPAFPFLFGGTFIEGPHRRGTRRFRRISLPFRRDFH